MQFMKEIYPIGCEFRRRRRIIVSSEEDVELYVEFINLVARMILGILTGKIS